MRNAGARIVFLAALFLAAGCDHASKQLALAALEPGRSVSLAHDTLRLELASNPGGFLSLGAGLPEPLRDAIFLGAVPLVVLFLCAGLLRRGAPRGLLVGLGLLAGGGLANWLDRLLNDGAVTDFLVLRLGPLHTGIFNVADVAVVVGAALLVASRPGAPRAAPDGP